jgi:hypothetical protein
MTTALEGGEGSASRPSRSLLPGKTRYPLYRRLSEPQGRSVQVRKISPPTGFDPRTVQPVACRYTDWATRPTIGYEDDHKLLDSKDLEGCCLEVLGRLHLERRREIIAAVSLKHVLRECIARTEEERKTVISVPRKAVTARLHRSGAIVQRWQ